MDKVGEKVSFTKVANIAREEIAKFPQFHQPVQSAKYLMGWLKEDVDKVSTKIISSVQEKTGLYLPSAKSMRLFSGDGVLVLLGRKTNKNILYPNFLLVSLYQFGGGGKMQHSGLSLGELVVPYVYLEVGTS